LSWQAAKAHALAWFIRAGLDRDLRGKVLSLPDFAGEEDCRFFLPGRSLRFHRMILKAASRIARQRGACVRRPIIRARRYLDLFGARDTLGKRARYLAHKLRLRG